MHIRYLFTSKNLFRAFKNYENKSLFQNHFLAVVYFMSYLDYLIINVTFKSIFFIHVRLFLYKIFVKRNRSQYGGSYFITCFSCIKE